MRLGVCFTTLENSYTVPMTVEEWDMLMDMDTMCDNDNGTRIMSTKFNETIAGPYHGMGGTGIPVPRFIDLMNDRIVPWRLEEIGFVKHANSHRLDVEDSSVDWVWKHNFAMIAGPRGFSDFKGITTFTELIQLIKFLTPPTEKQ